MEFLDKTDYLDQLVQAGGLDRVGFSRWVFYPGMRFGSLEKWWGPGGNRPRPHEGLDLCLFEDQSARLLRVDGCVKVPVMVPGVVARVDDDYLAKSVFVQHGTYDRTGRQLYSVYAHVDPESGIAEGCNIAQGDIVARIADVEKKAPMLPHLHLSLAWIPETFSSDLLTWDTLSDPTLISLCDPLEALSCTYRDLTFDPEFNQSDIPRVGSVEILH